MARVYPISYFLPPRDKSRRTRVDMRRDLGAALELMPSLLRMGHDYGEPILNAPPSMANGQDAQRKKPFPVDLSFVEPEDLLLQTTRPPLSDKWQADRKQIEPGHTDLEQRLFAVWRRFLLTCARSHVDLHESVHEDLAVGFEHHKGMKFREARGAPFKELNALDDRGWRPQPPKSPTAAFLLRVEEAWQGGPGLIGMFGMDSITTLAWSYRLSRDFAHLLQEPGFVVAQLQPASIPDRPTNLRWAMDWGIELMLRSSA